ncbi:MAG: radical SAM protein [Candidatus Omnitrophica bacterium]|nr:radical SAM protein [Candidatus Omnitrophota bacterium]
MVDEKPNYDMASAWNNTNRGNQKYDAWLHWNVTTRCNLSCIFCCGKVYQQKTQIQEKPILEKLLRIIREAGTFGLFAILKRKLKRIIFGVTADEINIPSLIRTLDKTKKIFRIGFTGGEPFLISNFIEACQEITKKHFIALNTNLTSNKIKEFCEKIDPLRVVHFNASTHIKELERLNLMDRYICNFLICKECGFNIFSREVAFPPLLGEVDKYKRFFKEAGIELTFGPFCGEYQGKQYPQAYTEKEIEIFGLNKTSDSDIRHFYQKGKFCNVGYNVGVVDLYGDIQPCFLIKEAMGNIYGEISFRNELIKCPFEFCGCPFKDHDNYLFEKALEEHGVIKKTKG